MPEITAAESVIANGTLGRLTMSEDSYRKTAIAAALGLVIGGVVALICHGTHQKPIDVLYRGTFATAWPGAPRPLFVITNQSEYRIAWTVLAPEFREASGWTTVQIPNVRFGGETLAPHTSFEIYGIPATNVAYRYAVLWGLHPADALSRPKWKRIVDALFEKARLPPPLLPHGVERSPVIPPQKPTSLERTRTIAFSFCHHTYDGRVLCRHRRIHRLCHRAVIQET